MNMKNPNLTTGRANPRRWRGFTLVELLLVLTILAILAGVVIPRLADRAEQARRVATHAQIANLATALSIFELDNGYFPKAGEGLQSLLTKPRDAQNTWKGPYLQKEDKVPLDPWKRPYVYQIRGKHNPASYDLYTNGKDEQGGTNVIGNWTTD